MEVLGLVLGALGVAVSCGWAGVALGARWQEQRERQYPTIRDYTLSYSDFVALVGPFRETLVYLREGDDVVHPARIHLQPGTTMQAMLVAVRQGELAAQRMAAQAHLSPVARLDEAQLHDHLQLVDN